jgi:hypothetical protein
LHSNAERLAVLRLEQCRAYGLPTETRVPLSILLKAGYPYISTWYEA